MADDPPRFELEGEGEDGRPKWLLFPCQMAGADPEDRCRVSINGQRNGSGATWTSTPGDRAGVVEAPTVSPSVKCGDRCHFHLEAGVFKYCGDHKGRRDG